ncbi:hypothetical protein MFLAVUS_003669 [Mucor flavus]|uniref:Uncharacterized protein n=1 Tax=Mucor flavus TaxID=439312 RepID=A0ABP9YTQ4_9FUNG
MINNLRFRSLATRVYVFACSRSSTPFQERDIKNHEIYDELSNIDGDTQVQNSLADLLTIFRQLNTEMLKY